MFTLNGKQVGLDVTDPDDDFGALQAFNLLVSRVSKAIGNSAQTRPETLAALVDEFLAAIKHKVSSGTIEVYGYALGWFATRFPAVGALEVTALQIERQAAAEGWSDNYRGNCLLCAQSLVRWAGRPDFKLAIPAKESRGAEAVIDTATHARILEATRGDFRQLCRFLWAVGCRPGEATGLMVEMVDFPNGTVTLQKHKTKRKGKVRVLYLSSEALQILREQATKHGSGPLFRGNKGRQFSKQAIVTRFLRLSESLGKDVFCYQYRHSFATRALQAGVPDATVAALLGHTGTTMLFKHYAHLAGRADLLRQAADKVA